MKYNNWNILLGLLVVCFLSCQSNSPKDLLYQEVMDIHDEVMPKVHDIHKLSKALETKVAEADLEEAQKTQIKTVINQLDDADKAMWDWMNAFERPARSMEEAEAMKFLQAEKEKISKVSTMMLESITAAERLLGQ